MWTEGRLRISGRYRNKLAIYVCDRSSPATRKLKIMAGQMARFPPEKKGRLDVPGYAYKPVLMPLELKLHLFEHILLFVLSYLLQYEVIKPDHCGCLQDHDACA